MNPIEKEVKFIIECHEKCGDDAKFLERLKELFLTGDISKPAFEIAKLMYHNK